MAEESLIGLSSFFYRFSGRDAKKINRIVKNTEKDEEKQYKTIEYNR